MYLDKPMRDHVLLQAIARVNRPYEDDEGRKKPSGFILDFVGIFENLEKALAFDSTDIEGVVHDLDVLKVRFTDLMKRARQDYLRLIEGKGKDKAVESLLQHFMEEDIRQEYYRFFKETSTIYEILSPDAFLSSYIKDYETLARIYRILKEAYEPSIPVDKEFLRKTARLVQKHTHSGMVKEAIEIYEINEDTLKKIEESHASDTEKIFNLLKSIQKEIEKYKDISPYLISIGEKAEHIAKLFMERQKHTQETLVEFKKLIQEINEARKEQAEKNIPVEAFSIFWMLKKEGVEEPEDKANQMNTVLNKFPHWKVSERQERSVKQELYKILVKSKVNNITEIAKSIIRVIKGQS